MERRRWAVRLKVAGAMAVLLGPASAQAQAGIPDLVGLLLHTIAPKRIGAPVAGSVPVPGDTAAATGSGTHTNPGSVALFDIAGVRIGMTVAEATAAMQKLGYTINSTTTTLSFQQEVAIKVAQRRNQGFADGPRKSPSDTKATTKLGAGRRSLRRARLAAAGQYPIQLYSGQPCVDQAWLRGP